MKLGKVWLLGFSVLAAPLAVAQEDEGGAPAAVRATEGVSLSFPIQRLTEETSARLRKELGALDVQAYQCPQCERVKPAAGTCRKCKVDLRQTRVSRLEGVEVADGVLRLGVRRGMELRLSELERVLDRSGVTLDEAGLTLAAPVSLVFRGGSPEQEPDALAKALWAEEIYPGLVPKHDPESGEFVLTVVRQGDKVPTRAAIVEALKRDPALPRLVDVIWGDPPKAEPGKESLGKPSREGDPQRKKGGDRKKGGGKKKKGKGDGGGRNG